MNNDCLYVIEENRRKGRTVLAKGLIEPGVEILLDDPIAAQVRVEKSGSFCDHCFLGLGDTNSIVRANCRKQRTSCSQAYCSKACATSALFYHSIECDQNALTRHTLSIIGRQYSVDPTLLMLCVRILSRQVVAKKLCQSEFLQQTPLLSHREKMQKDWLMAVTNACKAIVHQIQQNNAKSVYLELDSPQKLVDRMVIGACQININAHGIKAPDARNTDIGVGLYQKAPLFNHSCRPNATFINVGQRLAVRSCATIQPGEEIFVSYVDLYTGREERKQFLLATKFFDCQCSRCLMPMEKSVDKFLDGICCPKCPKSTNDDRAVLLGAAFINSDFSLSTNSTTNFDLSSTTTASSLSSTASSLSSTASDLSSTSPASSLSSTASSSSSTASNLSSLICCRCKYTLSTTECSKLFSTLRKEIVANQQKGEFYVSRRQRNDALKCFEHVIDQASKYLDDLHVIRFNSLVALLNCYDATNNLEQSLECCKQIIECCDSVFGPYYHETSNFYEHQVTTLDELMSRPKTTSKQMKEYRKRRKHALSRCKEIRTVVFGKDHLQTLRTFNL